MIFQSHVAEIHSHETQYWVDEGCHSAHVNFTTSNGSRIIDDCDLLADDVVYTREITTYPLLRSIITNPGHPSNRRPDGSPHSLEIQSPNLGQSAQQSGDLSLAFQIQWRQVLGCPQGLVLSFLV
jgi:hypothetical protein